MVGTVGRVMGVPRPGAVTVQETINLLAALGSGTPEVNKMLKEMKSVQDHNEKILEDARTAVAEADIREAEVAAKGVELARDIKEAEVLYAGRLKNINDFEGVFRTEEAEANAKIDEKSEDLSIRENELRLHQEEYEESLRTGRLEFEGRTAVLDESRKSLKQLKSSVERREQKVKKDNVSLEIFRDSLNEREIGLNNRDARVRIAMEEESVEEGR